MPIIICIIRSVERHIEVVRFTSESKMLTTTFDIMDLNGFVYKSTQQKHVQISIIQKLYCVRYDSSIIIKTATPEIARIVRS